MLAVEFNAKKKHPEEWRLCTYPTVRQNQYEISSYGRVRNKDTGKILTESVSKTGYNRVKLRTDDLNIKDGAKYAVHRLVAWEYCPGYDESTGRTQVNHKDSTRNNNYYENLEWVTAAENTQYSYGEFGLHIPLKGEECPVTKFTEKQIRQACGLIEQGLPYEAIAKKTGVSASEIGMLASGRVWKSVSKDYNLERRQTEYSVDQIRKVCEMLVKKCKFADISKETGVTENAIANIAIKKRWRWISKEYDLPETRKLKPKLSEDTVRTVCEMIDSGTMKKSAIVRQLNISPDVYDSIRKGKSYFSISSEYKFMQDKLKNK